MAANLKNQNALIIEQNNKVAKKLLISGGGKCNITNQNINPKNYFGKYEHLKQSLDNFTYKDNLDFFKNLDFKMIRNKQFFANSSSLVKDEILKKIKINIKTNIKITKITKENDIFTLHSKDVVFKCKNVVLATGGISFSELGVSDLALNVAKDFDIGYSEFKPALVPFGLQKQDFWLKGISGISLDVKITIGDKIINSSLLCTHKGISGPSVLSVSLWWEKGFFMIDFLADFKNAKSSKKQISSSLKLPKNFIKAFLNNFNLDDKAYKDYTKDEKELLHSLNSYKFAPAGTLGFNKAEICKGGVFELDENYQSKVDGMFFIGECVDIGGILGGFNIHFAFASAKKLADFLNDNV